MNIEWMFFDSWWWLFLLPFVGFVWAPKTWTPGELVSAAAMNTNIRDHLNENLRTQATALTGNQDDFALDGPIVYLKCNNATALVLRGGLIDSGNLDGAKVIIEALNAAVTLKNQDAGSATANRIITLYGDDLEMVAGERVLIVYDGTATRWRASRVGVSRGIGTGTIPHGGIGIGGVAIEGPDSDVDGPHVQMTTDSDNYPLFQMYMWSHDAMGLAFDSYYDGANWKSSDAGSNFLITKAGDIIKLFIDSGVAAGSNNTFTTVGGINPAGHVGIGTLSIDTSALLELDSTTGALELSRMTTTQRDALAAQNGMVIYNTTLNKFQGYENGAWTSFI